MSKLSDIVAKVNDWASGSEDQKRVELKEIGQDYDKFIKETYRDRQIREMQQAIQDGSVDDLEI